MTMLRIRGTTIATRFIGCTHIIIDSSAAVAISFVITISVVTDSSIVVSASIVVVVDAFVVDAIM